jgi:DNA-binding transcriptional regulator YdaS (Cro superfamily)
MESLRKFLNSLEPSEQVDFAARCETSVGYLRKAISTKQAIRESLAIDIERESGGKVRVESIRPDVDWAYLRGSSRSKTKSLSVG